MAREAFGDGTALALLELERLEKRGARSVN